VTPINTLRRCKLKYSSMVFSQPTSSCIGELGAQLEGFSNMGVADHVDIELSLNRASRGVVVARGRDNGATLRHVGDVHVGVGVDGLAMLGWRAGGGSRLCREHDREGD
jgi:hypothetical protein